MFLQTNGNFFYFLFVYKKNIFTFIKNLTINNTPKKYPKQKNK